MLLAQVETLALTAAESAELARHESVIERGLQTFYEVGGALLAIRDDPRKLYRRHGTFEDYCRERWGLQERRAYQLLDAAAVVKELNNCSTALAALPATESQARPLTRLEPEQQREAWQTAVATAPKGEDGSPRVTAAHVENVVRQIEGRPHVAQNSGNNEWYTPAPLIAAARATMGGIDCDPASSEKANAAVGAKTFFTQETDGLRQEEWGTRVWMNPPYAQPLIGEFSEEMVRRYEAGQVREACILVNNATETAWFQTLLSVASAVCFLRGRVKFIDPEGNPSGAPLQGQAVLYLGEQVEKFAGAFELHGKVLFAGQ